MTPLVSMTVVFFAGAYLVCAIPFGLIIAKSEGHVDVRRVGSGNIGTTNVARSVGKRAAVLTLLCDLGKGLACMLREPSSTRMPCRPSEGSPWSFPRSTR